MRVWYLRRAVPWPALVGCTAAAVVVAAVLGRWPETALLLAPAMLGCCAAAAGFAFDEPVAAIAAVTPRGALWARTSRLLALLVPAPVWLALVLIRPGDLPLDRPLWLLSGTAALVATAGVAAHATLRELPAPGSSLAALVVFAVLAPVVVAMFLGRDSIYPIGEAPAGVRTFWTVVGAAGLLLCASALRPGVRR
jgi:hypothetical protein